MRKFRAKAIAIVLSVAMAFSLITSNAGLMKASAADEATMKAYDYVVRNDNAMWLDQAGAMTRSVATGYLMGSEYGPNSGRCTLDVEILHQIQSDARAAATEFPVQINSVYTMNYQFADRINNVDYKAETSAKVYTRGKGQYYSGPHSVSLGANDIEMPLETYKKLIENKGTEANPYPAVKDYIKTVSRLMGFDNGTPIAVDKMDVANIAEVLGAIEEILTGKKQGPTNCRFVYTDANGNNYTMDIMLGVGTAKVKECFVAAKLDTVTPRVGEPISVVEITDTLKETVPLTDATYQWQVKDKDGVWQNIAGATDKTFVPDNSLLGSYIRCEIVPTNTDKYTEVPVYAYLNDAEKNGNYDGDDGVGTIGEEKKELVDAKLDTLDPVAGKPITVTEVTDKKGDKVDLDDVTYKWQYENEDGDWVTIPDETDQTYTPDPFVEGKKICCEVTPKNLDAFKNIPAYAGPTNGVVVPTPDKTVETDETDTTIKIEVVQGVTYEIYDEDGNKVDEVTPTTGPIHTFDDLTPDTSYDIVAKKDGKYSDKTPAKTDPVTPPVVTDQTETTITIEVVPGVTYTIYDEDGNKVDEVTPTAGPTYTFENLTPDTPYDVTAKKKDKESGKTPAKTLPKNGGDDGKNPGGDDGKNPGGDDGKNPSGDDGKNPGGDDGKNPGNKPDKNPGTNPDAAGIDDGSITVVIDPDKEYEIVDKDGNVVADWTADGSGNDKVQIVDGKLVFGGLDANTTYTVVSRVKGDTNKNNWTQTSATTLAKGVVALKDATLNTTTPGLGVSVAVATVTDAKGNAVDVTSKGLKFQWQVSTDGKTWTNIPGAKAANYVMSSKEIGKRIRCEVTGIRNYSGTVYTEATKSVDVEADIPTIVMNKEIGLKKKFQIMKLNTKGAIVTFYTADKKYVTVNKKGVITGKKVTKPGKPVKVVFNITKGAHQVQYVTNVRVTKKVKKNYRLVKYKTKYKDPSIALYKLLYVNSKYTIKLTHVDGAKITYKSSNKKVATVGTNGVVKGKKKGTADITITVEKNGVTYKYFVKCRVCKRGQEKNDTKYLKVIK